MPVSYTHLDVYKRQVPNSPNHLASIRGAVPIFARALTLMSRLSLEGPRYDTNDDAASTTAQTRTESAIIWDFVLSGTEGRWGLTYAAGIYNAFDSRVGNPVSNEFVQRTIPITGRTLLATASVNF